MGLLKINQKNPRCVKHFDIGKQCYHLQSFRIAHWVIETGGEGGEGGEKKKKQSHTKKVRL